jgi:hypothetical protein
VCDCAGGGQAGLDGGGWCRQLSCGGLLLLLLLFLLSPCALSPCPSLAAQVSGLVSSLPRVSYRHPVIHSLAVFAGNDSRFV